MRLTACPPSKKEFKRKLLDWTSGRGEGNDRAAAEKIAR